MKTSLKNDTPNKQQLVQSFYNLAWNQDGLQCNPMRYSFSLSSPNLSLLSISNLKEKEIPDPPFDAQKCRFFMPIIYILFSIGDILLYLQGNEDKR